MLGGLAMSGHSKWHNIQAKKGKVDAKRGKIFTKIGKELMVAVKNGGPSEDSNSKLRDVIAKTKSVNMPSDNIQRAIKKAAGELDSVNYEDIIYEGYGPSGIAVIVESLTDNKNRTAGNVRHAFTKHGGNLGSIGCVSFMFQRKGQMVIEKNDNLDEDEMMMMTKKLLLASKRCLMLLKMMTTFKTFIITLSSQKVGKNNNINV